MLCEKHLARGTTGRYRSLVEPDGRGNGLLSGLLGLRSACFLGAAPHLDLFVVLAVDLFRCGL
jgi:hypothetical protein